MSEIVPSNKCAQRRFRSAYAFAQSGQNLHMTHFGKPRKGCKVSSCVQRRLLSDCADAQADLSLRWAHISEGTFSHLAAQLSLVLWYFFIEALPGVLWNKGTCPFLGNKGTIANILREQN